MLTTFKNKSKAGVMLLSAFSLVITSISVPVQVFAAECSAPLNSGEGLTGILNFPTCIINTYLVPGAIALEIILFIAGIIMYVANGDNESKRTEATQFMLWGILAIFVTLSVWGLVAIIRNTLQI